MAMMVNMAVKTPAESPRTASPLFLREPEIRRGIELMILGYNHLTHSIDDILANAKLGRAHHRALYFIARRPGLTVGGLLALLQVTKQSLGRVLTELGERGLVETRPGVQDRRQKLLYLTDKGKDLECRLFEVLREHLSGAYSEAGQGAVGGFWAVLEGLVPEDHRESIAGLDHEIPVPGKRASG